MRKERNKGKGKKVGGKAEAGVECLGVDGLKGG